MNKDKLVEQMLKEKGDINNTIDLDAYARGLIDMFDYIEKQGQELHIHSVIVPKGTFCSLYNKECIGDICSAAPNFKKCTMHYNGLITNLDMKHKTNILAQFKQWILSIVMPRFLCFFFEHKKAVPMLIETDWAIFTKGCPRCKTHLGMPTTWKNCPPPPNSDKEQLESWEKFKIKHYSEIRASVNGA